MTAILAVTTWCHCLHIKAVFLLKPVLNKIKYVLFCTRLWWSFKWRSFNISLWLLVLRLQKTCMFSSQTPLSGHCKYKLCTEERITSRISVAFQDFNIQSKPIMPSQIPFIVKLSTKRHHLQSKNRKMQCIQWLRTVNIALIHPWGRKGKHPAIQTLIRLHS